MKYTVFIGRFQPPHVGHLYVAKRALQEPNSKLIIAIGSANRPRRVNNPFTYSERVMLWESILPEELKDRVIYISLDDKDYMDQAWVFQVKHRVTEAIIRDGCANPDIYITGHEKDQSSYYLKYFPEWKSDIISESYDSYAATEIRNWFYEKYASGHQSLSSDMFYGEVKGIPDLFWAPEYQNVLRELAFEYDFDKNYDPARYHVNVLTVDAVVVCNGHVLTVVRKNAPGKGLYAMPGGHINPNERLEDAMLRELREETGIDLSDRVLRANIKSNRYFDKPGRSNRARVITQAFLIHLTNEEKLPNVKGGDDASRAFWMPINEVRYENFFEDHAAIIEQMTAGL